MRVLFEHPWFSLIDDVNVKVKSVLTTQDNGTAIIILPTYLILV